MPVKYDFEKKYFSIALMVLGVILCSILFFLVITRWSVVKNGMSVFFGVLTPFIWGFVIAYILTPILNYLEKKILVPVGKKLFTKNEKMAASFNRGLGIAISLGLFVFVVLNLLILVVTQIYNSLPNIERLIMVSFPAYFNNFAHWTESMLSNNPSIESIVMTFLENVYNYFMEWIQTDLFPQVNSFISSISTGVVLLLNGILNIFIALVVAVYLMFNKEYHGAQFKKLLFSLFDARYAEGAIKATNYIHKAFGGFLSGKILDSMIIGVICFFGVWILQMPSPALIAIIIGITNIIPFFGPFIGAVPCALLILLESTSLAKCLIFVIFIIALQQFDGNILGPKILSNSTGLTGIWVLFAIVVGGGLFGFVGMVCGVPVFSVIYGGFKHLCEIRLRKRSLPIDTAAYIQAKKEP